MSDIRFDITGPGMLRASQEAFEKRSPLVIVYDQDDTGHLLRVGYYLEDKEAHQNTKPIVNWFKSEEITIEPFSIEKKSDGLVAHLDVGFTHPRENERHMLIDFPVGPEQHILIRCLFRIKKCSITDFVIQVEIKGVIDGKEVWQTVVRYDCAHGFIHRDMFALNGGKYKTKLPTNEPKQSVLYAIDEIGDQLDLWLQQLGYVKLDPKLINNAIIKKYLEKTKLRLIGFIENPNKIEDDSQSNLVLFQ